LMPILYIILFGNIIPRKIPFERYETKHNLTQNDLKAVMERESSGQFMVVNVNKRGLIGSMILSGAHTFKYEFSAFVYIHSVLKTLKQNFDVGPFQINSHWIKSEKVQKTYLSLMNPFKSIGVSAKILGDNYKTCSKNGFTGKEKRLCAYSMYNTGYSHLKSSIGKKYAEAFENSRKNIHSEKFDFRVMYIPVYGYIKI